MSSRKKTRHCETAINEEGASDGSLLAAGTTGGLWHKPGGASVDKKPPQ